MLPCPFLSLSGTHKQTKCKKMWIISTHTKYSCWLFIEIYFHFILMMNRIILCSSEVVHLNAGKKRPLKFTNWKQKGAKMAKDLGKAYVGHNGLNKTARTPPLLVLVIKNNPHK